MDSKWLRNNTQRSKERVLSQLPGDESTGSNPQEEGKGTYVCCSSLTYSLEKNSYFQKGLGCEIPGGKSCAKGALEGTRTGPWREKPHPYLRRIFP